MSLLTVIIVLVVVGIVLWLINAYVPMDPKVKKILNIVVIVFLVIWLLKAFGVWGELSKVRVENEPAMIQKRYFYYRCNLTTTDQTDRLIVVMNQWAAKGYNVLILEDYRCLNAPSPGAACLANIALVKSHAQSLGMAIVPFPDFADEPTPHHIFAVFNK